MTFFPSSVGDVVKQALPWTLGLVGMSTVIAFVLGTLIGMLSAWRRGGFFDAILPPVFIVISAFPYFWLGLIVLLVFSLTLGWFPLGFAYDLTATINLSWSFVGQVIWHGFLPALTIVVTSIGGWILTMRNTMITTLAEDYVKMARAKGLSPVRIMFMYAGRNAILPNLTGFAMSLGFVISGAILVEIVFNYPGLGFTLLQAVHSEDFALMQTLFLMITVAVLVAVLAADVLTAWLDPRTREALARWLFASSPDVTSIEASRGPARGVLGAVGLGAGLATARPSSASRPARVLRAGRDARAGHRAVRPARAAVRSDPRAFGAAPARHDLDRAGHLLAARLEHARVAGARHRRGPGGDLDLRDRWRLGRLSRRAVGPRAEPLHGCVPRHPDPAADDRRRGVREERRRRWCSSR